MVITTTAVGFITLSLGLAICGWLFLRTFKKSSSQSDIKIGVLLAYIFLGFAIQNGTVGFGTLFFAKNPEALYRILLLSNCLLTAIALLGVYTAYYIFSPQSSARIALLAVSTLGAISIIAMTTTPPKPFITPENGIDLNMNLFVSLTVAYLLFTSIGSTVYIFTKLSLTTVSPKIKKFSLMLAALGVIGIINILIRFILLHRGSNILRTGIFDVGLGIIGFSFLVGLAIVPFFKNLYVTRMKKE